MIGFGAQLDDYNFHPSVNSAEFDSNGTLSVMPVVGEVCKHKIKLTGQCCCGRHLTRLTSS